MLDYISLIILIASLMAVTIYARFQDPTPAPGPGPPDVTKGVLSFNDLGYGVISKNELFTDLVFTLEFEILPISDLAIVMTMGLIDMYTPQTSPYFEITINSGLVFYYQGNGQVADRIVSLASPSVSYGAWNSVKIERLGGVFTLTVGNWNGSAKIRSVTKDIIPTSDLYIGGTKSIGPFMVGCVKNIALNGDYKFNVEIIGSVSNVCAHAPR